MTFDLIRFVLSIMGQPVQDMPVGNYPTERECRQAIRALPQHEKRPGIRFECRHTDGRA